MEWLGPALVFYVAVAAALVSRRRLTHIARLRVGDVARLLHAIRSDADEELRVALSRAPAESFESFVVAAMLDDAPPAARIATVNEYLGDLDRDIETQRDVPKVIGRGSLLCGTLASVVELALTVAGPTGPAWGPAASSFLIGLGGFVAALEFDRRGRALAAVARAEWDRVGAALGDRIGRDPRSAPVAAPAAGPKTT